MDYKTTLYRNEDTEVYEVSIQIGWEESEQWYSLTSGVEVFNAELVDAESFLLNDKGNVIGCPIGNLRAELESEAFEEFCKTREGKTRYGKRLTDHSFI